MPDWLLNNIMKVVAAVFLKMIASKSENLPKDYIKILEEKKDFYAEMLRKFERGYLQRKVLQNPGIEESLFGNQ